MNIAAARSPQLNLKLDSGPDPANRWHDGASLAFLGGSLRLVLGTRQKEALREGDTLDLPLPPQATPRQIQDRAEAWLRAEAKRRLQQVIEQKFLERRTALALAGPQSGIDVPRRGIPVTQSEGRQSPGRHAPRLALSFAARGHWVEVQDGDTLRCNWRLIEQPIAVIEQAIAHAIAALPPEDRGVDLFGTPFAAS